MTDRYLKYALPFAVLVALIGIGYFCGRFVLYLMMRMMILSIFAMGYNLLFGRTGLLSFGHAAFYAAGAYGVALCSMHLHSHPLVGIAFGIISAVILAGIIGYFCVRHTEIYFAMLTLAFGMMVFSLMWNLRDITGGDDGLSGIMRGAISFGFFEIPITKDSQFYYLVVFLFSLSILLIHRIYQSPFGLILAGIRENHVRTEFSGLAVRTYRLAAFVVSGAFAGLAGALSLLLESNVTPFSAHWSHSADPVFVSLMGGLQTFSGPLVGSVVFVGLREVIERFTYNWMLWFGLILLAIILGFRGGIVGSTEQLLKRFTK